MRKIFKIVWDVDKLAWDNLMAHTSGDNGKGDTKQHREKFINLWQDNTWRIHLSNNATHNKIYVASYYVDYPIYYVLLLSKVTQWYNILLMSSILTSKSSISCSDIREHKGLCLVKYYILMNSSNIA